MQQEIDPPRLSYLPYFLVAAAWSIFIGAVLFFFVGVVSPEWSCTVQRDNGRGAILEELPEGTRLGMVTTDLGSPSGFLPQRRCRLLDEEQTVIAEADYPSTLAVIAALLVTLLPIFGVTLWRVIRGRGHTVPIR